MKKWMLLVSMAVSGPTTMVAGGPQGQDLPHTAIQPAGRNLWRTSVAVVAAANAADAGSSWGKRELNPTLSGNGGRFGGQGAALKLGIVGGLVILESLVLRRQPSTRLYRRLSLVNFASASVTGATAIRNLGIPRQ